MEGEKAAEGDPRLQEAGTRACLLVAFARVVAAVLYVVCGWMLHDPQRHHQGHPPILAWEEAMVQ